MSDKTTGGKEKKEKEDISSESEKRERRRRTKSGRIEGLIGTVAIIIGINMTRYLYYLRGARHFGY